jgi:hypothetical protein
MICFGCGEQQHDAPSRFLLVNALLLIYRDVFIHLCIERLSGDENREFVGVSTAGGVPDSGRAEFPGPDRDPAHPVRDTGTDRRHSDPNRAVSEKLIEPGSTSGGD